MIAMDDGVRKSLAERHFDIHFALFQRAELIHEPFDETHELIYVW